MWAISTGDYVQYFLEAVPGDFKTSVHRAFQQVKTHDIWENSQWGEFYHLFYAEMETAGRHLLEGLGVQDSNQRDYKELRPIGLPGRTMGC